MRYLCSTILIFSIFFGNEPLELVTKDIYLRPFRLSEYRGRLVVLIFTNKNYVTSKPPTYSDINTSHATNQELQSIVIFSSKGIPRIGRYDFRKNLIIRINEWSQNLLEKIKQEGKDPTKVIYPRYLTDWKSIAHDMFDMDPNEETYSIAILDREGKLAGHFPGEEKYNDAIQLMQTLLRVDKESLACHKY